MIPGLAPEGVTLSSSPARGDTVFITVHWDVGTDIELELDFGDGSPLYSWNWQVRVYSWNKQCVCTRGTSNVYVLMEQVVRVYTWNEQCVYVYSWNKYLFVCGG